jgi:hypothetical protein
MDDRKKSKVVLGLGITGGIIGISFGLKEIEALMWLSQWLITHYYSNPIILYTHPITLYMILSILFGILSIFGVILGRKKRIGYIFNMGAGYIAILAMAIITNDTFYVFFIPTSLYYFYGLGVMFSVVAGVVGYIELGNWEPEKKLRIIRIFKIIGITIVIVIILFVIIYILYNERKVLGIFVNVR